VLWTSQVSGKQIVKNTKINGIDRPAGPGRAFHSPGRAGPKFYRAGLGIFGPCRALPTFAAFVIVPTTARPQSSFTDDTLQLYDVVADLSLTLRLSQPSSSTHCRWPPGFDNVTPSPTSATLHGLLTPCRDSTLRPLPRRRLPAINDDNLCRYSELATPLGYAAYF